MRWFALCVFVLAAPGCKKTAEKPPAETERAAMRAPQSRSAEVARPLKRCYEDDASGDPPRPLPAVVGTRQPGEACLRAHQGVDKPAERDRAAVAIFREGFVIVVLDRRQLFVARL